MSIKVGALLLNCHFFSQEEIEFDLDPREIESEVEANYAFAFMKELNQLLNKEVIMTPENTSSIPIFIIPQNTRQIQYVVPQSDGVSPNLRGAKKDITEQ